MRRCGRCGRLGDWVSAYCPDCQQTIAQEERNRIDRERLKAEQEERKRQAEEQRRRDEEQRHRDEEQRRRDEERNRQEREDRQRQLDAENRYREEQRRRDEERDRQEREDRQRQLDAEERYRNEQLRIERERIEAEQARYEEEKREKKRQEEERAWAERCAYFDSMSDEDMKMYFENQSNFTERAYLKQRYRNCISQEDYLSLIKDEDKYVTQKRIQHYLQTHSEKESVDYLLNIDSIKYSKIVEKEYLESFIYSKEPLLNDFLTGDYLKNKAISAVENESDFATKTSQMLSKKFHEANDPKLRQVVLRIIVSFLRFLQMSDVEKQIFFREFVTNKMQNVEFNPNGYDTEDGMLFTAIEPLYIAVLDSDEQKKYIDERNEKEKNYRAKEAAKQKQKDELKACIIRYKELQKEIEEKSAEIDEKSTNYKKKWDENESVVAKCNSLNEKRGHILSQLENEKNKKQKAKKTFTFCTIYCFISLIFLIISAMSSSNGLFVIASILGFAWPVMIILIPYYIVKFFHLNSKIKKISAIDKQVEKQWDDHSQTNANLIKELEKMNQEIESLQQEKNEKIKELKILGQKQFDID